MRKFKKIILAGVLFVMIGLPAAALAADPPPALNPVCWKEKECSTARKQLAPDTADQGWVKNNPPCTGGEGDNAWGMCLPPLNTVTEISFGGSKNFTNIGVFILQIYNYAVGVAAVLATVMIIISGAQWAVSGGNTETINNSKKRIAGAVIGLFIALMSNFILNSINPALVNLRLPQVWMVKKQGLVSEFCSASPSSTQFALASDDTNNQTKPVSPPANPDYKWVYTNPSQKEMFWCGKRFFMKDAGASTCFGDVCQKAEDASTPKTCARDPKQKNNYGCLEGSIIGKVSGEALLPACLSDAFKYPFIKKDAVQRKSLVAKLLIGIPGPTQLIGATMMATGDQGSPNGLYLVCNNGGVSRIAAAELYIDDFDNDKSQMYRFVVPRETLNRLTPDAKSTGCASAGGYLGVVMVLDFNKTSCAVPQWYESHWIGKNGTDIGIAPYEVQWDANTLIPADDLKKGITNNIDTNNVSRG